MKKNVLLTCAAVLALALPLAACDNDQPQTPQNESAASSEGVLNLSNSGAFTVPLPATPPGEVAEALDDVEGVSAPLGEEDGALPQNIADENIPPPPSREDFTDDSCDFEAWVGQKLDEEAVKATGRPHRIVKPGDAMTMDFRQDRINVEHEDGKVTRVWCG